MNSKIQYFDNKLLGYFVVTLPLILSGCSAKIVSIAAENQQYVLDSSQPESKDIDSFIYPFRDSLERMVDKTLATSDGELTIGRQGRDMLPSQVALGNFMTDAILKIAREKAVELKKETPDISFSTWGGFRKSLPKGEVTLRNVFELMPFENEMVVINLSGERLNILLKQLSKNYNPVSGASMVQGDANSILINGEPVDVNKVYRVVTSDYYAYGGDNMSFLLESEYYFSGIKIRDALVLYLQQLTENNQTLKPDYEPRIKN